MDGGKGWSRRDGQDGVGMSKKKPPNPYEEAMRNIDRIIAELDAQLKGESHVLGRKDK